MQITVLKKFTIILVFLSVFGLFFSLIYSFLLNNEFDGSQTFGGYWLPQTNKNIKAVELERHYSGRITRVIKDNGKHIIEYNENSTLKKIELPLEYKYSEVIINLQDSKGVYSGYISNLNDFLLRDSLFYRDYFFTLVLGENSINGYGKQYIKLLTLRLV